MGQRYLLTLHRSGGKSCNTQTDLVSVATRESHVRADEHGVMNSVICRYVTSARGSRAQPAQMEAHPERRSLDSDGGSEMDADCCGDSGQLLLISMHPFLLAGSKLPSLHAQGCLSDLQALRQ